MIIVLGAGLVGTLVSGALAKRGYRDVRVYDPNPPAAGSTAAALGGFRTQHGSRINVELALASLPYFKARADRIEFRQNGYLYFAEDEATAAELAARAALQEELGLPIEHPDPRRHVPELNPAGFTAVNYCGLDGVYLPGLILGCAQEEARSAGVRFHHEQRPPPGLVESARAVIICAGAWSRQVGEEFGVELPVDPLARTVFQVGPFDWLPASTPMTLSATTGYHFRQREGFLCLMGPGDQHDFSPFAEWLRVRLPRAYRDRPAGRWTGNYEMTPDQHALVGATARTGLWCACGFSGHGVMQAPAVAESLSAMMLGDTVPLDLSSLSPLRQEPLFDRTQV